MYNPHKNFLKAKKIKIFLIKNVLLALFVSIKKSDIFLEFLIKYKY